MERADDLLEEPLYIAGTFVRRWDEFPRLPRPADTGDGGPPVRLPRPRPAVPS